MSNIWEEVAYKIASMNTVCCGSCEIRTGCMVRNCDWASASSGEEMHEECIKHRIDTIYKNVLDI